MLIDVLNQIFRPLNQSVLRLITIYGSQVMTLTAKYKTMKKYSVQTESKGLLTFDEFPKGTYFQEGSQDINDKGKAMYYTYDTCGTCLIPIIDTTTGQQVKDISKAGLSIQ